MIIYLTPQQLQNLKALISQATIRVDAMTAVQEILSALNNAKEEEKPV